MNLINLHNLRNLKLQLKNFFEFFLKNSNFTFLHRVFSLVPASFSFSYIFLFVFILQLHNGFCNVYSKSFFFYQYNQPLAYILIFFLIRRLFILIQQPLHFHINVYCDLILSNYHSNVSIFFFSMTITFLLKAFPLTFLFAYF